MQTDRLYTKWLNFTGDCCNAISVSTNSLIFGLLSGENTLNQGFSYAPDWCKELLSSENVNTQTKAEDYSYDAHF